MHNIKISIYTNIHQIHYNNHHQIHHHHHDPGQSFNLDWDWGLLDVLNILDGVQGSLFQDPFLVVQL